MKKFLYGAIIVLVIALVVIGAYLFNLFNAFQSGVNSSFEGTDREGSELREGDIDPSMDSFTVLILGVDENEARKEKNNMDTDDFRTDTMMLATFDKDADEVKLTGIPRDTLTYFPEQNYFDKITHAHREGGPDGSMKAVESLLNVPVDFYVRVNMSAVVDVVDAIGGVEFDVPFDMNEPNSNDDGRTKLEEGKQTLNGEEALAVVRSRRVDTDLGRGQRQLEMVEAILGKAKSTGALTKLDDLIKVVADNTKHNMKAKTIRSLAAYYSFNDIEFNSTQVRGSDYWNPGNGAYFYWANEEHLYTISKTLRETLGLEEPEPYDLINVRLADYITPYQYVDDYYLEEFEPEVPPYFMQEGYEPQFGDGFEIPDSNPEESIEGEGDIESNPEAMPEGESDEESTEEQSSEEPTQEESVQEESSEAPYNDGSGQNYDDGTGGQYDEQPAQEEYNGGTGGFEGNTRSYNGV
ncbi:LCP family protein [Salinicoccus halodurans]|uniref:Alpha/beta hydrolase n=1 Tax=Salinicoccus halodurans TaxID=407035 RepID=A0A0F7HIS0_9STAP|nr:LCP family protein [Salinicoccus halodurans]AKG73408.1 alpha/beta hydrolase [Salinicoccus halodurans]SFK81195.1 transcriptional attenuator, LytR family [Salinicoccus halodurans]